MMQEGLDDIAYNSLLASQPQTAPGGTEHVLGCPACRPCIAAVLAFVVAQVLKVFTYWYSERRWDFTRLIGSGGMPSSHTGCVRHTTPPAPTVPVTACICIRYARHCMHAAEEQLRHV